MPMTDAEQLLWGRVFAAANDYDLHKYKFLTNAEIIALVHPKCATLADAAVAALRRRQVPHRSTNRSFAMRAPICPNCKQASEYSEKYDTYFCRACNVWTERECDCEDCTQEDQSKRPFPKRPESPNP